MIINQVGSSENLKTELARQDELIAQLSTALNGKSGITLPILINPGSAENLQEGYQLIDSEGNIVEGTLVHGAELITVTFRPTAAGCGTCYYCDENGNLQGRSISGSFQAVGGIVGILLDDSNLDIVLSGGDNAIIQPYSIMAFVVFKSDGGIIDISIGSAN